MTDSSTPNVPAGASAAAGLSGRYAIFRRHDQFFGLGIEFVTEVLPGQPLTKVPRSQSNILGVMSLRGEILPVVTVDELLDLEPQADDPTQPILVLHWRDIQVGLRVDAIQSVITLNAGEIQPHPTNRNKHFAGIWRLEGDVPITLTLLAGMPLLEILSQQSIASSLPLQTVE